MIIRNEVKKNLKSILIPKSDPGQMKLLASILIVTYESALDDL